MDETLSLRNFTDLLAPDALDRGKAMSKGGQLRNLEKTSDGFWVAECTDSAETFAPLAELGHGQSLTFWDCDCHEVSAEEPCAHIAALLYTLKNNELQEKPITKHGRPKAGSVEKPATKPGKNKAEAAPKIVKNPKPKDPAEALLGELEPREIFDFVRELLAKNKDFKSQFLMRFADKNTTNDRKFDEIMANAIAAVKGRRKHLKGADGAKIATALAPLGKQAAAAESKGFFREAVAICMAFVEQLPPVFVAMATPSAKLEGLFFKSLDVLALVAQNENTPFEFRQELFTTMLERYRHLETTVSGDIVEQFYAQTLASARAAKRLPDLAAGLRELLRTQMAGKKRNIWQSDVYWELRVVRQLYELFINELQDDSAALRTLEDHRDNLFVYYNFIDALIQKGDFATAERHLEGLSRTPKTYRDQAADWEIKHRIQRTYLILYQKSGDQGRLAKTAGALFEESNYRDFELYDVEKSATEPDEWAIRVEAYIKKLTRDKLPYGWESLPLLEILVREKMWSQLLEVLSKRHELMYWLQYGVHLRDTFPADFLANTRRVVERAAQEANTNVYPVIAQMLESMALTEGGTPVAQDILRRFRDLYGGRPSFMKSLSGLHF